MFGPPTPESLEQALNAVRLLAERGVLPYRAVLGVECTIGLFLMAGRRHVELELTGDGSGVLLELRVAGRERQIEEFDDLVAAVDRAVSLLGSEGGRRAAATA
ncbi:MAG: hypothetical protein HYU66_04040 [Armatimonadetes bacterium]|nr:hypothetical protein [Armatimonadota bacterium]